MSDLMLESKVREIFTKRFRKEPEVIVKAPGRINIIGEHTDYNNGYVLPAAINNYMYLALSKNDTNTNNIYSIDFDESASYSICEIQLTKISWLNLINGVVDQLKNQISGFDLVFCGDIPEGAGLSSSAALCCGTAFGISSAFKLNLEKWDMAKIAQKSEHDFAGVQCGIMDQFASLFGVENCVLTLDCLNLTYEESEIDIEGYQFILLDSNVKHQLNESEYNVRREESTEALKKLQSIDESIKTFRDVKIELLDDLESNRIWWKRAYHIVSENQRVLAISHALKKHELEWVGRLLSEGHVSQKDHYEITCEETDFLVKSLINESIVLGARQVGGGFGGCVLCIAKNGEIDDMVQRINKKYDEQFGKNINVIPIQISQGCHLVN